MSTTPPRKNTSWVRILLSAALLGVVIYFVQRQPPSKLARRQSKPLPVETSPEDITAKFSWVPRYPGAEVDSVRTQHTAEQTVYAFQYEFQGEFQPVLTYYEQQLKGAGFKVERKAATETGQALHAEDAGPRRTVDVMASRLKGITEVDVTAAERVGN
jgi:hypothetical protein